MKTVRQVESSIDDYFDTQNWIEGLKGVLVKAKFRRDISAGVRYLEEVTVEKVQDKYKGMVNVDPQGTKRSEVSFCYSTTEKGDGKFTELRGPRGNNLKGSTEKQTREYINGSVPYAIMCLERQIKQEEKLKGTFYIPRTYDK